MIILVQSSFFIYQLLIDLSSAITSGTLTLINPDFFLLTTSNIGDLAIALIFGFVYIIALFVTCIVLLIRHAFVAVGVALFPIGIFFYFFQPLRQYGSLIFNFLGIAIFITIFDALLLAGFSQLLNLTFLGNLKVLLIITAFVCMNVFMLFILFFGIVKSAFSVYNQVKRFKL